MNGWLLILLLSIVLIPLYLAAPASAARQRDTRRITVEAVDSLLPQTQCGKCGYAGCRPYAEAITRGETGIDHCPPGGEATRRALATLLGQQPDTTMEMPPPANLVALIDEQVCIGCVKCIRACPVDAIIGAPKRMHTVISQDCTGCGLCLPPCPVDCISLVPVRVKTREWVWSKPDPSVRLRG